MPGAMTRVSLRRYLDPKSGIGFRYACLCTDSDLGRGARGNQLWRRGLLSFAATGNRFHVGGGLAFNGWCWVIGAI